MQLARVCGNVVASVKYAGFASRWKLLLTPVSAVDPGDTSADAAASVFTAIDLTGAGAGEIVQVTHGRAARVASDGRLAPTDSAVIAIVDSVQLGGQTNLITL